MLPIGSFPRASRPASHDERAAGVTSHPFQRAIYVGDLSLLKMLPSTFHSPFTRVHASTNFPASSMRCPSQSFRRRVLLTPDGPPLTSGTGSPSAVARSI